MSKELKTLAIIGAVVIGIIALLVLVIQYRDRNQTPIDNSAVLVRETSYKLGPDDAPVQVVEFGDYQCPACASVEPAVQQLKDEYGDQVQWIWRHFPLPMHGNAPTAAQVAEAAGAQDSFWEMHETLFAKQGEWASAVLPMGQFEQYASDLGLDVDQFKQEIDDRVHKSTVDQDVSDGQQLGVSATPTFFIDGQRFTGANSYQGLKQAIDQALANADSQQSSEVQATEEPEE